MSKRILSVVLAVIMVLSLALSVCAIDLSTGEIGFIVETDATKDTKVGDLVTVTVSYAFPADTDVDNLKLLAHNVAIGYNTTYFQPSDFIFNDAWSGILKDDVSVIYNEDNYTIASKQFTTADKALYTGEVQMGGAYASGQTTYTGTTGFPVADTLICTFRFECIKAVDADNVTFGIPEGCIGKLVNPKWRDVANKKSLAFSGVVVENAVVGAGASTYKVADDAVKIRFNAEDSSLYDLGFTGYFRISDFDPEFDDNGTSAKIDSVGVEVTIGDVTNEYTDRWVYEKGTDQLQFRAALCGLPATDVDVEISVRMFVVYEGEKFFSEGHTTTLGEHIGRLAIV